MRRQQDQTGKRQEKQLQEFASWLHPQEPLKLKDTQMGQVPFTLRGQIQSQPQEASACLTACYCSKEPSLFTLVPPESKFMQPPC